MIFTTDAEVEEVAAGVYGCKLPKEKWTHAAHFAAAIWFLRHCHGFEWARDMPRIIRSYNESVGKRNTDQSGYHETITFASMRVAEHFLAGLPEGTATFQAVNRLLQTSLGRQDWLLSHWSRNVLFDVAARRHWVEPDLAPLPDVTLAEFGIDPDLSRTLSEH